MKVYLFKEKIIFEDKALRPHDPHDRDKTLPRVKVNFVYKWFIFLMKINGKMVDVLHAMCKSNPGAAHVDKQTATSTMSLVSTKEL